MERLEREVTRAELEVVRAADDADRLRSDMEEVLRVAEGRRKDLDASKVGLLNSQRRERRLQVRPSTLNPRFACSTPRGNERRLLVRLSTMASNHTCQSRRERESE